MLVRLQRGGAGSAAPGGARKGPLGAYRTPRRSSMYICCMWACRRSPRALHAEWPGHGAGGRCPGELGCLITLVHRSLINREGTPIARCAAKGPPVARRHPRAPGGPPARVYCLANGSDIDAAFSRCAGGMRWPRRRRKRPAAASESRCFRLSAFVIKAISHTRHLLPPPPASYAPFSAGGPPTGHGPAPS